MRITRRVWCPDEFDVAIVAKLAELGDGRSCVAERAELAYRLGISVARMETRLDGLARYGYVIRQRLGRRVGVRYWVLRVPAVTDVHELRPPAC